MRDVSLDSKVQYLVTWMRERAEEAGAKGGVFGVSGGVDSALVLALAKRAWPENCLGLVMPCHSLPEDVEDALYVLREFSCPYRLIDLSPVYDGLVASLPDRGEDSELALANIKPRLRMITLYYYANLMNYIVVGTGNKAELHVGYFTKYGDGGVDILPLGDLTKREVRQLAKYLGVPERIVERVPSAGLWRGQTDEGEMGITYRDLDAYLSGEAIPPEVKERIDERHRRSEHKRRLPPVARLDVLYEEE